MKIRKVMWEYYDSKLKVIKATKPYPIIQDSITSIHHKKLNWEDIFGYIVTAGYLILSIIPDQWFSLGRCLFSFSIKF